LPSVSDRAARAIAYLTRAGYRRCEPAILQPASIFFDSGEDLRAELYLTSDPSGADYCLRPEYTIPVLALYLGQETQRGQAAYSYCGPVFRFRPGASSEFIQAGIESFGRSDREAADAEILALAIRAAAAAQEKPLSAACLRVRTGDARLLARFLEALDLPPQWRRRLVRGLPKGKPLDAILSPRTNGGIRDHSGLLALIEGADKQGAHALVEDLLAIAGVSAAGGRSAAEIAERFLEQAALRSGARFAAERRVLIERFLEIEAAPGDALKSLRALARDAGIDLSAALDQLEARFELIASDRLEGTEVRFAAAFTGALDYYTGFVFEAHHDGASALVAAGGRYDALAQALGSARPVPAVGAAIWLDNLGGAP